MSRDMSFSIFMGLLLVNGSGIGIALRHLRRERQTSSSARPSLLRVLKPPGSIRSRRAPGRGAFAAGRKPGAYRLCACRATRISGARARPRVTKSRDTLRRKRMGSTAADDRSEEHTSELQSLAYLVCRLLLEKKKKRDEHHRRLEVVRPTLVPQTMPVTPPTAICVLL